MRRIFLALSILALTPLTSFAHNVGVDCKLRGDKVEVEGYYDDDTAAAKAKVKVVNARDEVVASGVTDDKGRWTFAAPPPGKYVVHLDAGAGHRAKKDLVVPVTKKAEESAVSEPSAPPTQTISEGPTRDEFTRTPWLKAAIGLVVIGGLMGAFMVATRMRKNAKSALELQSKQ